MGGATVEVICACGCGEKFTARVSDRKRGWGKFATKSCKAKSQEKRTHQMGRYLKDQYYRREYGGTPVYDRRGEYVGFMGHDHEHDCNKE